MRTTVTLDDDLMADAAVYSGITDKSKIINLALDHYIKRMAAKRLVALGGTMPDLDVPDRHRSEPARYAPGVSKVAADTPEYGAKNPNDSDS